LKLFSVLSGFDFETFVDRENKNWKCEANGSNKEKSCKYCEYEQLTDFHSHIHNCVQKIMAADNLRNYVISPIKRLE